MIDGAPRVTERDGSKLVVDAGGHELVARRKGCIGNKRIYHQVDIEAFENGTVEPACENKHRDAAARFILRRRSDLDAIWSGCSFTKCYGDFKQGTVNRKGPTLAVELKNMSVEEFDARVNGESP